MTMNLAMMTGSMPPALSLGDPPQPAFGGMRPTSTFSVATSMFAGLNNYPNPSDEELYQSLGTYLSTQDLVAVTKKWASSIHCHNVIADHTFRIAREAMAARFPRADLTPRKDFLNQSIMITLFRIHRYNMVSVFMPLRTLYQTYLPLDILLSGLRISMLDSA
jgi:chitin synthase